MWYTKLNVKLFTRILHLIFAIYNRKSQEDIIDNEEKKTERWNDRVLRFFVMYNLHKHRSVTCKEILIATILSCYYLVSTNLFGIREAAKSLQFRVYFHGVLLIFLAKFPHSRAKCPMHFHEKKKSLFLITQFYIIKLAVLDSGIVTVGVSSSGANSIRHSASINRIIYLYIRNTVQIHNNLNIFNIGLIKMKGRWKELKKGKVERVEWLEKSQQYPEWKIITKNFHSIINNCLSDRFQSNMERAYNLLI